METLSFEARESFQVPPEALWPLLADTPRLNRAIGLPPIEYQITPVETGGSHVEAAIRVLGLPLVRWTEHPFRWEAPRGYVVLREFRGGPFRRIRAGVQLQPSAGGTDLRVYAEILPRHALGRLLVNAFVGQRSVDSIVEQCRLFERFLLGQAPDPFPRLAHRAGLPAAAESTAAGLARHGLDERAIEQLRRHLAEASDDQVVKMRPFELADRWGLDRRKTLKLFLHATTAGLLVMTWDVLCPNCRVGKSDYRSLRELRGEAHCEACNITFGAQFDRLVEVRFSVAPALRQVENREFCLGGPMNTPHIVLQAPVAPGATEQLHCRLQAGSFRLRAAAHQLVLDVHPPAEALPDGAAPAPLARLELVVETSGIRPRIAETLAGELELSITNRTDRPQVAVLEGNVWPDTVATAALVSTMQEFRDLFSSEALAPGLQLGIENLAFMFTDLTGSTALYQAVGQARAFRLVQDHFQVLGAAIAANRGALIKTIGDAVMAAFPSGADALAAALRIQRDIRTLAVPESVDASHLVKIGLHQGPCVAVTLNDRLDYFGTTVNTAARIEHECRGGQIVASLAVCQSAGAEALVRESGARIEEEVVRLRGVAEPVAIYRLTPRAD